MYQIKAQFSTKMVDLPSELKVAKITFCLVLYVTNLNELGSNFKMCSLEPAK